MKLRKTHFHSRVYKIPELFFEDQRLSSFAGLIVFQAFFSQLNLKFRLKRCFGSIHRSSIIGVHTVALILIVHIILGFRRLGEMDRYKDDPIVLRVLGLRRFPDVATVSSVYQSQGDLHRCYTLASKVRQPPTKPHPEAKGRGGTVAS